MIYNARFKRVLGYAGSTGEQFAAAIAAVAVESHLIPFLLVERLSVRHSYDAHFLSVGLGDINFIVNPHGTVEVERQVFKLIALLVANRGRVEQHDMVVGRGHRIDSLVITKFQMLAYLLACHTHYVDIILVFVELEHVAEMYVPLVYDGVKGERGVQ